MNDYILLDEFTDEWAAYLEQRGHRMGRPEKPGILASRCGRQKRYRWMLFIAAGPAKKLTAIDHLNIRRQIAKGKKRGEEVYLAVRFGRPACKILVLPAERVAKTRLIKSDVGGIFWDSRLPFDCADAEDI